MSEPTNDREDLFNTISGLVGVSFRAGQLPFILIAEVGEGGLAVASNMNNEGIERMLDEVLTNSRNGELSEAKAIKGDAAAPPTSGIITN